MVFYTATHDSTGPHIACFCACVCYGNGATSLLRCSTLTVFVPVVNIYLLGCYTCNINYINLFLLSLKINAKINCKKALGENSQSTVDCPTH